MKRNSYSTYFFLGIMMFCRLSFVEVVAQKSYVTGQAVKVVKNRRDIYHPRNENARKELMRDAVKDAIEKGEIINMVGVETRELSGSKLESTREKSYEEVFDDYVSQNMKHYNVKWSRTSNYNFTLIEPKKWKCEVNGEVSNLVLNPHYYEKNKVFILPEKVIMLFI